MTPLCPGDQVKIPVKLTDKVTKAAVNPLSFTTLIVALVLNGKSVKKYKYPVADGFGIIDMTDAADGKMYITATTEITKNFAPGLVGSVQVKAYYPNGVDVRTYTVNDLFITQKTTMENE